MRIQLLTGGAVLSGPLGSMTCADFTAMGPTAQADAVKQIGPTSLTSNSGTTTTATPAASGTAAAGTPLEAGQLVAACQAAGPTSTVHDAYSSFSSPAATTTKK
jgi:hypothetical protein